MPLCKLHGGQNASPRSTSPRSSMLVKPPTSAAVSCTQTTERWDVAQWNKELAAFAVADRQTLHHLEKLDRRVATLRMRIEHMTSELKEVAEEYAKLQSQADIDREDRQKRYERLCACASARREPPPSAPCSVAGYHDTSTALRGADGKLLVRVYRQRTDRAPDWLPMLTAVLETATIAWGDLVHETTDVHGAEYKSSHSKTSHPPPLRLAIEAIKQVGNDARARWQPQYNLRSHADGLCETVKDNVITGGVPFSFSDRYGKAWRKNLTDTRNRRADNDHDDGRVPPLPPDYWDQTCWLSLIDESLQVDGSQIALEMQQNSSQYIDLIYKRWIRERADAPLSWTYLEALATQRARAEVVKKMLRVND